MRQVNQQFSSILTKIGNGEPLEEMAIALIESRFCTVEEAVARCPLKDVIDANGLRYQTIYVNNIYYMITTNVDVTDVLANDAVGKLIHVETNDEGLVNTQYGLSFQIYLK
ncbi:ATP-dependent DNA helicase [Trichonephila clavipes]|nr:ATP-dependent DNA helicase [Trichonephila clavipes]